MKRFSGLLLSLVLFLIPAMPACAAQPGQPSDESSGSLTASLSLQFQNADDPEGAAQPVDYFSFALGSLAAVSDSDSGGDVNSGSPAAYGSPFELTLFLPADPQGTAPQDAQDNALDDAYDLQFLLPEGFSFDPRAPLREKTLTVSRSAGEPLEASVTVYPLYLEAFPESGEAVFSVCDVTGADALELASLSCPVRRAEDEGVIFCRPTQSVNASSEAITVTAQEMGLDFSEAFAPGNDGYQESLAKLGCALSLSVYGSIDGDQTGYIEQTMQNLGFSEGEWYGPGLSHPLDSAVYVAQKKVVSGGGVRNILMIVVRGTYNIDWIGNFYAYGDDEGHKNFIDAAEALQKHLDEYAAAHMAPEDYALTTAFICGHSRAGAVADVLAERISHPDLGYFCSEKKVYTFAAANAFYEKMEDPSVHNIIFVTDPIGYVPFSMYKYGTDYVIGTKEDAGVPQDVLSYYRRFCGKEYEVPLNNVLIGYSVFSGTVVRAARDGRTRFEEYSGDAKTILEKTIKFLGDAVWFVLEKGTLTVQYVGGTTLGIVLGVGPEIPLDPWLGETFRSWMASSGNALARAHGAENYLAWMMGPGIEGARPYSEVTREMVDRFDPEVVFGELKETWDAMWGSVQDAAAELAADGLERAAELMGKVFGEG